MAQRSTPLLHRRLHQETMHETLRGLPDSSHIYVQSQARSVRSPSEVTPFVTSSSRFLQDDKKAGALIDDALPMELILCIFSKLDVVSLCRCARVSKFWNFIALDGSLWSNIDFFSFQKQVKNAVVDHIAKRCGGFLRRLSLYGCERVNDGAIFAFSSHCRNIEELDLSQCPGITDAAIQKLSTCCTRIRKIALANCSLISNAAVGALLKGCRKLQYLDVSWCTAVGHSSLAACLPPDGLPPLETLKLKGCSKLVDADLQVLLATCEQTLVSLTLYGCVLISDQGLARAIARCSRLERICVSHCPLVAAAALAQIGATCTMLCSFESAGCARITDADVQSLVKRSPPLENIDLEDCTGISDASVVAVAQHCPNLCRLICSDCERLTDACIRELAKGCPFLETVELDNCPLLTDAALDHLLACKWLFNVQVYDCRHITRAAVDNFLQKLEREREKAMAELQRLLGIERQQQQSLGQSAPEPASPSSYARVLRRRKSSTSSLTSTLSDISSAGDAELPRRVRVHSFILPLPPHMRGANGNNDNDNDNDNNGGGRVPQRAHALLLARNWWQRTRFGRISRASNNGVMPAALAAGPGAGAGAAGVVGNRIVEEADEDDENNPDEEPEQHEPEEMEHAQDPGRNGRRDHLQGPAARAGQSNVDVFDPNAGCIIL